MRAVSYEPHGSCYSLATTFDKSIFLFPKLWLESSSLQLNQEVGAASRRVD